MTCPTNSTVDGALWEANPEARDVQCAGAVCREDADLARCCSKRPLSHLTKGHSLEAVCHHCACECLRKTENEAVESTDFPNGCPSPYGGWEGTAASYCDDPIEGSTTSWSSWKKKVSNWNLINSVLVTIINQALKASLEEMGRFEKPHTVVQEQSGLATKVWLAQFTNTVVLTMISTMYFEDLELPTRYPEDGMTPWANGRWYYQVGTSFVQTMLVNQCLPPFIHLGKFYTFKFLHWLKCSPGFIDLACDLTHHPIDFGNCNLCCLGAGLCLFCQGEARTQNRLNQIYELKDWKLASSYGEVLFVTSATLMLSTALPALLWVAAFGLSLKYWGDKYAVLRCYKKPKLYGSALFDHLDEIMQIILAMHLLSSTYFLSVAGGLTPDTAYSPSGPAEQSLSWPFLSDLRSQLFQRHVWPLWVTGGIILAIPAFREVYLKWLGPACAGETRSQFESRRSRAAKLKAHKKREQGELKAKFHELRGRYLLEQEDVDRLEEEFKKMVGGEGDDEEAKQMDSKARMDALKTALGVVLKDRASRKADRASSASAEHPGAAAQGAVGALVHEAEALAAGAVKSVGSAVVNAEHAVEGAVKRAGRAVTHAVLRDGEDPDSEDDDLFDAVADSLQKGFSLALGEFADDAEVDDPDANLPLFSKAMRDGDMINVDDHYDIADTEKLMSLQRSFRTTLDRRQPTLKDKLAVVHPEDLPPPAPGIEGRKFTVQRLGRQIGCHVEDKSLLRQLRPELYQKEEEEQLSESRRASAGLRLPPLGDPESVIYMAP